MVINFGLAPELVPSANMTNAYLRFTSSEEAVALYEEWVGRVSVDGFIHAPRATPYGMIEWGMTHPTPTPSWSVGRRTQPEATSCR